MRAKERDVLEAGADHEVGLHDGKDFGPRERDDSGIECL